MLFLGYGFSVIVKFTKKIGSRNGFRVEKCYSVLPRPLRRPGRNHNPPDFPERGGLRRGKLFFWLRKWVFSPKECIFAGEIVIHRMLIRLQYLLFITLFVLLGSAPSISRRTEGCRTCTTTVSEQQGPCMPSPARFCFATVCSGGEIASLSESAPGVKTPVRFNGDMRSDADRDFVAPLQVRIYRAKIPAPTVDYYVFSLERILI